MLEEDVFEIILVSGREVLDSRGNPTVEADVVTSGGGLGRAIVPSGASTGTHEALELRDGGERYGGRGVLKAVRNINEEISEKVVGMSALLQREVDELMIRLDGTPNKSRLGANAILAVSLAVAKAAAATYPMPLFRYLGGVRARVLPVPLMNIINGGRHAGNELAIQEFMIVPAGATSFSEALRMGSEIYHALRKYLREKYGPSAINVGDEGGFAPPLKKTRDALNALLEASKAAGYEPGSDVYFAIDAAASEFHADGKYRIDGLSLTREELMEYYIDLVDAYPIISIEDPFHEDDFEGFAQVAGELSKRGVQVVGDDLFVTNPKRLERGIEAGAASALLLKVNQIGTLSEALDAAEMAFSAGYRVIVSHRSGETEDTTISHIAVALNSGQIKTGAPARGERTAKYNELLRIEEYLGAAAQYPGKRAFTGPVA